MVMKPIIFYVLLQFILVYNCYANEKHDVQRLLNEINNSSVGLSSGVFEFHSLYSKTSTSEKKQIRDRVFTISFLKNSKDTLLGYKIFSKNKNIERLYITDTIFENQRWDSTLLITSKKEFDTKLRSIKSDYTIFPFFLYLNNRIQHFNTKENISKVVISDTCTWHNKKVIKIKLGDAKGIGQNKASAFFYIDLKTKIPIGQEIELKNKIGGLIETELFSEYISYFKFNPNHIDFTTNNFSYFKREIPFEEYDNQKQVSIKKVPLGSVSKNWTSITLENKSFDLYSIKAKFIVMTFWYKSCPPCLKQLVFIDSLSQSKYKDSNEIKFLSIYTEDHTNIVNLKSFIKRIRIKMLTLRNGEKIKEQYNIYSSPALIILDSEKRILYFSDEYSKKSMAGLIKTLTSN